MNLEDTSRFCLDVNLFTNCTEKYSNDSSLIKNTLNSFRERFGDCINNLNIFIDPQPNEENYETYKKAILEDIRPDNIIKTNGLADGYVESTKFCETEYIFQLEHDWNFLPTITHSLEFLVNCMRKTGMEHLRFNKRHNIHAVNEKLTEIEVDGCKFCKTTKRSNNPHIIDRKQYLEQWNRYIDLSNTPKRADGIENQMVGLTGYIYGPFNHPTQIFHTDGRS